jgi:hypothetical protein
LIPETGKDLLVLVMVVVVGTPPTKDPL